MGLFIHNSLVVSSFVSLHLSCFRSSAFENSIYNGLYCKLIYYSEFCDTNKINIRSCPCLIYNYISLRLSFLRKIWEAQWTPNLLLHS